MPPIPPTPNLAPQPNRRHFGPIIITWDPGVDWPIAVDHDELNGECAFVTASPISFRRDYSGIAIEIPRRFQFDGASIPRIFWSCPGFAPLGKHLWAALLHDYLCERPQLVSRVIADAIFADLLIETSVGWRGTVMALAVWAYGLAKTLRGMRGARGAGSEERGW